MKRLLEMALIKKAKEALLCSCEVDTIENSVPMFSNLPNSASFHIVFNDNDRCIPKWMDKKYLQENVQLNSALLDWIQSSKKNKTHSFIRWMSFMCTFCICIIG